MGCSSSDLRLARPATHGSVYLLTHRSWMRRMGTVLRKCNFSRPRRRLTTSPASSSSRRCFATAIRVMLWPAVRATRVWPSCSNSVSRRARRVGSASARNTVSIAARIGNQMVACQELAISGNALIMGLERLVATGRHPAGDRPNCAVGQMLADRHEDLVALGRDRNHLAGGGILQAVGDQSVCVQPEGGRNGADVDVGPLVKLGAHPARTQRRNLDSGAVQLVGKA